MFNPAIRIVIIGLIFINLATSSFAQATRTFVNMMDASEIQSLELNLGNAPVHIMETKGSRIIIETNVNAQVPRVDFLDILNKKGRYHLNSEIAHERMSINAPSNKAILMIKGEEIEESITYVISVPSSIEDVRIASIDGMYETYTKD